MNPSSEEISLEATKIKNYYDKGVAYLNIGDFDIAIDHFTNAINSSKYVLALDAIMARALCFMNNGNYIDAIKDYLNPLFDVKSNRDADLIRFTNLGYAYYNLGIYSESRSYYSKVLLIDPNDVDAKNMLDKI